MMQSATGQEQIITSPVYKKMLKMISPKIQVYSRQSINPEISLQKISDILWEDIKKYSQEKIQNQLLLKKFKFILYCFERIVYQLQQQLKLEQEYDPTPERQSLVPVLAFIQIYSAVLVQKCNIKSDIINHFLSGWEKSLKVGALLRSIDSEHLFSFIQVPQKIRNKDSNIKIDQPINSYLSQIEKNDIISQIKCEYSIQRKFKKSSKTHIKQKSISEFFYKTKTMFTVKFPEIAFSYFCTGQFHSQQYINDFYFVSEVNKPEIFFFEEQKVHRAKVTQSGNFLPKEWYIKSKQTIYQIMDDKEEFVELAPISEVIKEMDKMSVILIDSEKHTGLKNQFQNRPFITQYFPNLQEYQNSNIYKESKGAHLVAKYETKEIEAYKKMKGNKYIFLDHKGQSVDFESHDLADAGIEIFENLNQIEKKLRNLFKRRMSHFIIYQDSTYKSELSKLYWLNFGFQNREKSYKEFKEFMKQSPYYKTSEKSKQKDLQNDMDDNFGPSQSARQTLKIYSEQSSFYKILNIGLLSLLDPRHIAYLRYPTAQMSRVFRTFINQSEDQPEDQQEDIEFLYKCTYMNDDELTILKQNKGATILNKGPLSTSKNENIDRFGPIKIIIKLQKQKQNLYRERAIFIKNPNQKEQQYIFSPLSYFKVIDVKDEQNQGKWTINLQHTFQDEKEKKEMKHSLTQLNVFLNQQKNAEIYDLAVKQCQYKLAKYENYALNEDIEIGNVEQYELPQSFINDITKELPSYLQKTKEEQIKMLIYAFSEDTILNILGESAKEQKQYENSKLYRKFEMLRIVRYPIHQFENYKLIQDYYQRLFAILINIQMNTNILKIQKELPKLKFISQYLLDPQNSLDLMQLSFRMVENKIKNCSFREALADNQQLNNNRSGDSTFPYFLILCQRAKILTYLHKYQLAQIVVLDRLSKKEKKFDIGLIYEVGRMYCVWGKIKIAEDYFKQTQKLCNQDRQKPNLYYMGFGLVCRARQEYDCSLRYLAAVYKINIQQRNQVYYEIGVTLKEQGKYRESYRILKRGLAKNPNQYLRAKLKLAQLQINLLGFKGESPPDINQIQRILTEIYKDDVKRVMEYNILKIMEAKLQIQRSHLQKAIKTLNESYIQITNNIYPSTTHIRLFEIKCLLWEIKGEEKPSLEQFNSLQEKSRYCRKIMDKISQSLQ